ncbi:MAG TPA: hypothetical protein VGA99_06385 [bacterium]
MPDDYTPAELKLWITKLHDRQTPTDELQKIAMTLAHIDHPEALQALEAFRESQRAQEIEWIDCAIDECTSYVLQPKNEREEKDYIRLELWQEYEEELLDKMAQRDAAEVHKQHLEVEKELLVGAIGDAPDGNIRLQLMARQSGIAHLITIAENDRVNLEAEIAGLEYLLAQIERAIESPIYRKYGKSEIGVHLHRDCEHWLKRRKGKSS